MPGFAEMCFSGHHEACSDRECRCGCHPWSEIKPKPKVNSVIGTLVCPMCSKPPRNGDQFCRADGTRLVSGKMCGCGKSAEPSDDFCGGCGQKFGPPAAKVQELSEEEIAALEAKARMRPSDVEVPPTEIH